MYTFVNDNVGKDTPIKKPKTTPTKVVTISLILSFGFLEAALQPRRLKVLNKEIGILFSNLGKSSQNLFLVIYAIRNTEPASKDSHLIYNLLTIHSPKK